MRYLAAIATTVACMGGFIFGYDLGVISGVLVMPSFAKAFDITPDQAANVNGNIVALLQVGCCVGALLINFVAGILTLVELVQLSLRSIFLSSIIFIIGGILQVVSVGNLNLLISGRFFAGVGIGASSMLVPMYIAEIAPRKLRGRLGTLWQFLIVLGICISYWIDYACLRGFTPSNIQWQLALGIQIIPGIFLAAGILFMPESLRWLAAQNRHEDVRRTLAQLRNLDELDPAITSEMKEIQAAIDAERASSGRKFTEIMQPLNIKRLFIGIMLQTFQQWTGTNAINYYAPAIFQSIGIQSTEIDVLATGVYGVVKIVFVFISVLSPSLSSNFFNHTSFFMIDGKLGRRRTLMLGSLVICIAFYLLGGMAKIIADQNGGNIGASAAVGAPGYVAIAMVYLFAVGYEFSWGPIAWIVCSEIFPTRIRAICLSITTAFNWANNAIIGKVTPIMLTNIGWRTYFIFGSFAILMGLFVFFFLPETRGVSLEEIDEVFTGGVFVFNKQDTFVVEKVEKSTPTDKNPNEYAENGDSNV
ncbi:general substrate transporter [Endogone sp. FLAS-F59071]|nr:general substrate transporter [Endogone sp. FLAS-F59071]|eukprot:RUS22819.1 general substrate transporter [Endogone sp. FLAS-F59071]